MNRKNPFHDLTLFERCLWLGSAVILILCFLVFPDGDFLNLIASLIGITALIFVAKGYVLGQILTVIFALFYGVISFYFHYYGEMITYLGMTSPIAIASVISWLRHPFQDTAEVEVQSIAKWQATLLFFLTIGVTAGFYFLLRALGTVHLFFSTVSVATSFLASSLTLLRSPYYALAYGANDIILIVLWSLAAVTDPGYPPMVLCFSLFLVNDIYGFINWRRIETRQR